MKGMIYMTTCEMSPADYAAINGNNNNGNNNGWGGAWGEWILVFLIFAIFGWGGFGGFGNGFGGNGGGGAMQGALTREQACIDNNFQNLMRETAGISDAVNVGFANLNSTICNQQYDTARMVNGVQMQIANEFRGLDNAVCTLGYQTQQGQNELSRQLADCCCQTQQNIKDNTVQGIMNTNAIQGAIKDCCCDNEKIAMQNRFDMQQYNCGTIQAIDKMGDRIIDYLANKEAQSLRDENQALRLAASQQAQNNYLVNQLRPCPIPSYTVCNPYTGLYGYANANNYNFGNCGCACNG